MSGYSDMNAIRTFSLATAGAIALGAAGNASAATYFYDFQFDALNAYGYNLVATNIVFSADSMDPTVLTYVSGDVNGATSPQAVLSEVSGSYNYYRFSSIDTTQPEGSVVDMVFGVNTPLTVGQPIETHFALRGLNLGGGGAFYRYSPGRLTITQQAGAVPEPSAWALMIAGFGMAGAAMRRRATARVRFA